MAIVEPVTVATSMAAGTWDTPREDTGHTRAPG